MNSTPTMPNQGSSFGSGAVIAGKYRLESPIAAGGMGEVWTATNLLLESKVALKVLRRSLQESPEASARLLREARAAARISHHNIVQVFDFGYIETGEPFIVMELLRGESLFERLSRAVRISAIQAVEVFVPVAHALAVAHAKGIVHRDLKPANIFLSVNESNIETPKLVDFGIAKMPVKHDQRVTQEGFVLGSPEYLSPEQALGSDDIDARADVWALSVSLYETITGKLPFQHDHYNRLLRMIVEDEPVPTVDQAAGDEALWAIIRRGMAKKREDRWQSAWDFGAALEQWLENHGVFTTGGTFRRTSEMGAIPDAIVARDNAVPTDDEAVTRSAARGGLGPARLAILIGVPFVFGVAGMAWAVASSRSSARAEPPVYASASVAAPLSSTASSHTSASVPLPQLQASTVPLVPPASASVVRATPVGKRLPNKPPPAIPTEPNF